MSINHKDLKALSNDILQQNSDHQTFFEKGQDGEAAPRPLFWLLFLFAAFGVFLVSIGSLDDHLAAGILMAIIFMGIRMIRSAPQ